MTSESEPEGGLGEDMADRTSKRILYLGSELGVLDKWQEGLLSV